MTSSTHVPPRTQAQAFELDINYDATMLNEIDGMEGYDQHMSAYLALCIENKVIQKINQNKYKCSGCAGVLLARHGRITDSLLALKNTTLEEAKQPLLSTLKIVIFSNAVFKEISSRSSEGNDIDTVWKTILNYIDIEDLYSTEDFEQHEQQRYSQFTHKEEFVIQVVKMYVIFKSQKIGRKIADEGKGEYIRHKNKQAVHLAGQ